MKNIPTIVAGIVLLCHSTKAIAQTPPTPAGEVPSNAPTPGAAPPAGPAVTAPEEEELTFHARPVDMQQFAAGSLQEIHVGRARARYALNLFGDVSFQASTQREGSASPKPAFATGVFDMLFNAELADNILATSELTFAYDPAAPVAELERLHVRWKPRKNLFLEVGRFHTDIGYWNVAYHHGKWLQLPIERPRLIALHGGLVSTHMNGAQAGAGLPVGDGALNLVVSVGSGRDPGGDATTHGGQSHTTTITPVDTIHAKLSADDVFVHDLHFGLAGMYSRIPAEGPAARPIMPDQAFDEFVGNAFVAYVGLPLTVIAEGYEIVHRIPSGDTFGSAGGGASLAGGSWRTYGAFAVVGYTLGIFTPYVKGEYTTQFTNAVVGDPFYIPERNSPHAPAFALDLLEGTAGTRIDVATWCAVKAEYRITSGQATNFPASSYRVNNTGTISWSFGI